MPFKYGTHNNGKAKSIVSIGTHTIREGFLKEMN